VFDPSKKALAAEYCALNAGAVAVEPTLRMTTPLAWLNTTGPVPARTALSTSPVANETDELAGIIRVCVPALLVVTRLVRSVRAKVKSVAVLALMALKA
jgi:hypothetical protein